MASVSAVRTELFSDCIGVFQGGGCRAAAYAGAFAAATERGVHFSKVAGASAGSIAAVLIAAGATPEWLDENLGKLEFKDLLRRAGAASAMTPLPRKGSKWADLLAHGGFFSSRGIEAWVEARLRELLPKSSHPVLFKDLPVEAAVLAADLITGRPKVWSSTATPTDPVARAVRASCSIPIFFQPVDTWVDGGLISNLSAHLATTDDYDRRPVLAFTLEDEALRKAPRGLRQLLGAVMTTVVQGGQSVQTDLQPHVGIVTIETGTIKATDFDRIKPKDIAMLRGRGYAATKTFLDRELVNAHPTAPALRTTHIAATLDSLAQEFLLAGKTVEIATPTADWVFDLYPALLLARMKGVSVGVHLPSPTQAQSDNEAYQRELLRAMGCVVKETADGPAFQAFLFDGDQDRRSAVVYSSGGSVHASILRGRAGDEAVLEMIRERMAGVLGEAMASTAPHVRPTVRAASHSSVLEVLSKVDQYKRAELSVEAVPLDQIDSWAKYALSNKQRQQRELAYVLREHDLRPFEAFDAVYPSGQSSLALPPVLEASHDGRFTVVNGLSRLLILLREGSGTADCAVARNVSAPPPAAGVTRLSAVPVMVGSRKEPNHRYNNFQPGNSRAVEREAHTMELLGSP